MSRLQDIVASGVLGEVQEASAEFRVPILPRKDIRWNVDLGGGGLLDIGYYPVRLLRDLFGKEPVIAEATAKTKGDIDTSLRARLEFPGGPTATVSCALWSWKVFRANIELRGTRGTLRMFMPYHGSSRFVGK
jgi:predicted dehydrogenase